MQIKIDHIAKIEGHAGFTADIADGKVSQARLSVLEGARLLEGILRDRHINEVSQITARICGVCPVVHNLTSLKALENALNIEISEQTVLLRKLMMLGQIINSHALHLFFFSLSDFFGIKNDLKLIKKYPQKTSEAMAIREFGNQIIEIIGGRSIHPLTPIIGGFTQAPSLVKLKTLNKKVQKILPQAIKMANFFSNLHYPNFERETEFVSLSSEKEYAIYEGTTKTINNTYCHAELVSASQKKILKQVQNDKEENLDNIINFMQKIREFQVKEDAVKRTEMEAKPYMVGAIARLNHNFLRLNPQAKKILNSSKIKLPSFNPFHNILAQAIEIVHCVEETTKIIKLIPLSLRGRSPKQSRDFVSDEIASPASGQVRNNTKSGTAAIEAPRGTLFYFYEIGENNLIKNCNIITPTAQNLARLEEDLKIWLPRLRNISQNEIKDKIRMLVRAYDPCLTCATH